MRVSTDGFGQDVGLCRALGHGTSLVQCALKVGYLCHYLNLSIGCQILSKRVVCRLRAVVLLPTRDLARQVHAVITPFVTPSGSKQSWPRGNSHFWMSNDCLLAHHPYVSLSSLWLCVSVDVTS